MNDLYIHLTDRAIEAFQAALEKRNTTQARIRLGIKGGGCNGYEYVIQFEDDTPTEKDLEFFYNGIRVIVDKKSLLHLNGCTLDHEKTMLSQGFKFINPKQTSSCSCGKSFGM